MSTLMQPSPNRALTAIPPRASRRLKDHQVTSSDRNLVTCMHLAVLVALLTSIFPLIAAPIVIWLIRKDESPFADDHGREALNFSISFFLLSIVLAITIIGIPLILVLAIVGLVNSVRGAIAASNGEYFRYPMTFRFFE